MNPYSGEDFFGFFSLFFSRLGLLFSGQLSMKQLASDEVQCFVLLSLGAVLSFLGSFLVLRRMTMLANALSHTILLGIVMSFLLFRSLFSLGGFEGSFTSPQVLVTASLVSGLLTVFLTQFLTQVLRLQEDASIGLVFTTLFALGILFVTLYTKNLHLGTEAVMGNIDALHVDDLILSLQLLVFTALMALFFYKGFYLSTFDEGFAKSLGWPVNAFNYLLMVLTAAGAIASFRAVGVLLFLSLLVGPVLIALRFVRSFKRLLIGSFAVSSACSIISVALSRHLLTVYQVPISTSGLIATVLFLLYFLLILLSFVKTRMGRNVDL